MSPLFRSFFGRGKFYGAEACYAADDGRLLCRHNAGFCASKYIMYLSFPFFGYFIMPVPMTIIFMKYGLRYAVLLGVTVGVLMGVFIDPITALYQLIIFGSVGVA